MVKGITTLLVAVSLGNPLNFTGRTSKDVFPLHRILDYQYNTTRKYENDVHLMSNIINDLDIENNKRYTKIGVVYKEGKAYEIPLHEIRDFDMKVSHTNTYCNIFTLDVLNIMDTTLHKKGYGIVNKPVRANDLRKLFENSNDWEEIPKSLAGDRVRQGNVVVLSYTEEPHGHVAFVRPDSSDTEIYLWNVGSTNSNRLKWNKTSNTKYFQRVH